MHLLFIDANRTKRIHIQRPDLNVTYASQCQRVSGLFTGCGGLFGPDWRVKLVFNLQYIFTELLIITALAGGKTCVIL